MENIKFYKMHGIGNDYIYFDCFKDQIDNPNALAIRLSDRHKGIGGDGIVLICPSNVADAKMRMFNLDGSEGKMCGNAIRCVTKFLYDQKMVIKEEMTIETLSGIKTCKIIDYKKSLIMVDMGKAILDPRLIPVNLSNCVNQKIVINNQDIYITCVSMGNPHAVIFVQDVNQVLVEEIGKLVENHPLFPDKTNVEFIHVIDQNTLEMRVWERGSGETLACGTGACASVVASYLNGYVSMNQDILVKLKGGNLIINYQEDKVLMTGEAEMVFTGYIKL